MSGINDASRPLDAVNFFLADVRDGLGPYLSIYLLTVQHWDQASIGVVMSVSGLAAIVAQTPAGALIDATRAKRALIIAAAATVTICSLALPIWSGFVPVVVAQAFTGVAGAVFTPAIAAITLGIVGPRAFARRTGRNEGFNHAGNATAAALAGAGAYFYGPIVVFWLMATMALSSILAVLTVPAAAIDHDLARGLEAEKDQSERHDTASGWRMLFTSRPLLIFAACTVLFHFANAAMLPLAGQKLAIASPQLGTTLLSICIVAAQAVMVPVAIITGHVVDRIGRKPIFAIALAVLALRGLLYPVSDEVTWIVCVQLLDGVGAGIFGALFPIVVADLTAGTGHFNICQGAIVTALGLGAALSNAIAGWIVVTAGYGPAFLMLAMVAAAGLALLVAMMPETRPTTGAFSEIP